MAVLELDQRALRAQQVTDRVEGHALGLHQVGGEHRRGAAAPLRAVDEPRPSASWSSIQATAAVRTASSGTVTSGTGNCGARCRAGRRSRGRRPLGADVEHGRDPQRDHRLVVALVARRPPSHSVGSICENHAWPSNRSYVNRIARVEPIEGPVERGQLRRLRGRQWPAPRAGRRPSPACAPRTRRRSTGWAAGLDRWRPSVVAADLRLRRSRKRTAALVSVE